MKSEEDWIRPHLALNEKLLWAGRPQQGIVLTPWDVYVIPFSVLWIVQVWQMMSSSHTGNAVAVIFLLIGVYLLVGRYLFDCLIRSRQAYGVTDRRTIIVSGLSWPSVRSTDLSSLSGLSVQEHRNGRGSIFLGERQRMWAVGALGERPPMWAVGAQIHPGWIGSDHFIRIKDANKVHGIIRDAREQLRANT